MDTIGTLHLKAVEEFRHIVPPRMINGITGKTTMKRGLLMIITQLRDENLDSYRAPQSISLLENLSPKRGARLTCDLWQAKQWHTLPTQVYAIPGIFRNSSCLPNAPDDSRRAC